MTLRKRSSRACNREILPNPYFRESGNFKGLQRLFFGFALFLIKGDPYAVMQSPRGKFPISLCFLFLLFVPLFLPFGRALEALWRDFAGKVSPSLRLSH